MNIYTFSEARQNLAALLDQAKREGAIQIRRKDGSVFTLSPSLPAVSPLDVGYVDVSLSADEIVAAVREGRERS